MKVARKEDDTQRQEETLTLIAPPRFSRMPKAFRLGQLYLETATERWVGTLVWARKGLRAGDRDDVWYLGFQPLRGSAAGNKS